MTNRFLTRLGFGLAIPAIGTVSLLGSGFAIQEQSFSGLGNAFAGGAAAAEDASTIFSNPAGMSLIEKPQLHAGVHFILPEAKFTNLGSTTLGVPTQGPDSATDESAIVPNFYYVAPLNDDLVWGLGFSVPFGLTTDYDEGWVGRYVAQRTELKTLALNPSLAYRINDKLSIGGGFSYLKSDAVLSNAIDMGLLFLGEFQAGNIPVNPQTLALAGDISANLGGSIYDGGVRLEGDGEGWGYNVGLIYEFSEDWRAGIHYRSTISVEHDGYADFTVGPLEGFLGPAFPDQFGTVQLDLPDTLAISLYGNIGDRLTVMADVTRTGWSEFENLSIEFEAGTPQDVVYPELWNDVNKYSLGASYQLTDRLKGRFGVAYDESPVPSDAYRSPRIPDGDRKWLAMGLSIAATRSVDVHLTYVSIFVDDPVVDNSVHAPEHRLYGVFDAKVNLFSLGVNKVF